MPDAEFSDMYYLGGPIKIHRTHPAGPEGDEQSMLVTMAEHPYLGSFNVDKPQKKDDYIAPRSVSLIGGLTVVARALRIFEELIGKEGKICLHPHSPGQVEHSVRGNIGSDYLQVEARLTERFSGDGNRTYLSDLMVRSLKTNKPGYFRLRASNPPHDENFSIDGSFPNYSQGTGLAELLSLATKDELYSRLWIIHRDLENRVTHINS